MVQATNWAKDFGAALLVAPIVFLGTQSPARQSQASGSGGQPGNSRSDVLPIYCKSAMPILLV
jgi:hypothetical protein